MDSLPLSAGEEHLPALSGEITLYRDRYGVPAIFAATDAGAHFGFGYAQAESHLPELAFLVLQVRGRLAEAFGRACLESDRMMRTLGLHRDARAAWPQVTPSIAREVLEPFAAGINAYAGHVTRGGPAWLATTLPITGQDILALYGFFGFTLSMVNDRFAFATNLVLGPWGAQPGSGPPTASNAFALAPRRTVGGHAVLAANPHIHLSAPFLMTEARLKGAAINARGVTFFGLPLFIFGHTATTAWGVTINYGDTFDRYFIVTDPGDPRRYRYDGAWRVMTVREEQIAIRGESPERFVVAETAHGPVVARPSASTAIALAWSTRGATRLADQFRGMVLARDRAEFEQALDLLQTPNYSFAFADAKGALLYAHSGRVAARAVSARVSGAEMGCGELGVNWIRDEARPESPCAALSRWGGVLPGIPGWTSETQWRGMLGPDAFPRERDPPGGWLQMANSPPWAATRPGTVARCGANELVAPCEESNPYGPNERVARMSGRLARDNPLSREAIMQIYLDAHVTAADYPVPPGREFCIDRLRPVVRAGALRCGHLPRILAAWEARKGSLSESRRRILEEGIALLSAWDQRARRDSRAAALFQDYVFSVLNRDTDDAARLDALERAIRFRRERSGRLDPAWGEVHRFERPLSPLRRGQPKARVPMSGSWQFLGVLNASDGPYAPFTDGFFGRSANRDEDGIVDVRFGSIHMMVVELAPEGPRAYTAGIIGASEDPASPHFDDQTRELFGQDRLRRAPFTEEEVRKEATRVLRLMPR